MLLVIHPKATELMLPTLGSELPIPQIEYQDCLFSADLLLSKLIFIYTEQVKLTQVQQTSLLITHSFTATM